MESTELQSWSCTASGCFANVIRVVLVRLQGGLEKRPRCTGRGLVTHTTGGEEIWY